MYEKADYTGNQAECVLFVGGQCLILRVGALRLLKPHGNELDCGMKHCLAYTGKITSFVGMQLEKVLTLHAKNWHVQHLSNYTSSKTDGAYEHSASNQAVFERMVYEWHS